MRVKLSAAFIKEAQAEIGKDRSVFWDATMPGFGLMVTRAGARSFVIQYRAQGQKSRRLTLDANSLTLDSARREARKLLGLVAGGSDPVAERRSKVAATHNTLASVAEAYFRREGKKIRTMEDRRRTFE